MKKFIALLLVIFMCFCFLACGNSDNENEDDTTADTVELLDRVYDYSYNGMDYMLRAWNFSVQHSNDDTREEYEAIWGEYKSYMNVTEDEIVNGLMNEFGFSLADLSLGKDPSRGLNTVINGMLFMKSNYAVYVARYIYEQRNANFDVKAALEEIKENLKEIGEDSSSYELLKEYYLMVSEIDQWINTPDGSYNSNSTDLIEFSKQHDKLKKELDLL